MAEREELILDIEVESGDAKRDVQDLGDEFDETESKAKAAARTIAALAQTVDTEMRAATSASEALGRALGPELTARTDLDQVVADLNRMGLTFEEIEADAKALGVALKQVDDIKMRGVADGLDYTNRSMTTLTSNSNQSRSVLANLAGNSAQDLGQLGGIVGSLGVGIGQLAEYAVDGNIKLSQLASVAAPMIGLVVATQAVSTALAGIKAEAAFRADIVEDFRDALREAGDAAGSLYDTVLSTGQLDFSDEGGFLGLGQSTEDLLPVLGRLGLGFEDFMRLVQLSASGSTAELDAFYAELNAGSNQFGNFNADADALIDAVDQYGDGIKSATEGQRIFNEVFGGLDLTNANRMLNDLKEPLEVLPDLWDALIRDARDGVFDFENAATAISQLAAATGLSEEAIIARINTGATEAIQAETEAAEEAAEAEREHAEALAEVGAELVEVARNLDEAELRADGFKSALDRINQSSELTTSGEVIEFVDNMNALGEALREAAKEGVDLNAVDLVPDSWDEVLNMPEELGPVVDALSSFRESVQSEMAQAFESGGQAEVLVWAENTRNAIVTSLNEAGVTSEAAVNQVLSALGLLPDQINMAIAVSGQEQALATLAILQGAIDGLPVEVQLQIAAVAATDPVAALQLAIDAFSAEGIAVPVELTVLADQLQTDVDAAVAVSKPPIIKADVDLLPVTTKFQEIADDDHPATITAAGETGEAETEFTNFQNIDRLAHVSILVDNFAAARDTIDLAAKDRTSSVDIETGTIDLPTAAELRNRIGVVRIPIQAYWNTRVEGNRPI